MAREAQKITVTIDSSKIMERDLLYAEKHMAWHVFRAVYWSVYIFVIGMILFVDSTAGTFNSFAFYGFALLMLSVFIVIYGIVYALHLRLMRKYA